MTEVVVLESFSLHAQGPTASFGLAPGQTLAIVGPASSGKTRFLKCLCGLEKPAQGKIHVVGKPAVATREAINKRSTPQALAKQAAQGFKKSDPYAALYALGLYDLRDKNYSELSGSQRVGCELLFSSVPESRLMVVDGQLDRLDPWTLANYLDFLRKRISAGNTLVAVTNRPELLPQFDLVLVFDGQHIAYSGPVTKFLQHGPSATVELESTLQKGVRPLIEPFAIGVTEENGKVTYHSEDGQELAAKLLLEGYGDVKFVVVRQPTPEQTLMHLTKSPVKKLTR